MPPPPLTRGGGNNDQSGHHTRDGGEVDLGRRWGKVRVSLEIRGDWERAGVSLK